MDSFSYWLNMHDGTIFLLTAALLGAVLISTVVLNVWLAKKLKWSAGVSKALMLGMAFVFAAAIFIGGSTLKKTYDLGGIRKLFIFNTRDDLKLALWCTRIYSKKSGADYEQFIRTFDLSSAEPLGSVKIDNKYSSDDFRLYWSGGKTAWGYRKDAGVMLIDLALPDIIADNTRLLKQNPILGEGFGFEAFRDGPDPRQAGLYVKSADGGIFRLNIDFSVTEVDYVPVDTNPNRGWAYAENWFFYQLADSKGKHAHTRGAPCSGQRSASLLSPEFIPELNPAVTEKDRTWVLHKSALFGDFDILISYMSGNGVSHTTLNISKLVPGDDVKVLSTYTLDNEVFIFVGAGRMFRSNILGFSLSALKTDPETGALIEAVRYF